MTTRDKESNLDPGALVPALRAKLEQRARFLLEALPHSPDFRDDRIINESSCVAIAALLREAATLLSAPEAVTRTEEDMPDWMPSGAELLRHRDLYRRLEAAVYALDPAAADDKVREEWVAAKWNVFNAAVRLVRESNVSPPSETPETRQCEYRSDYGQRCIHRIGHVEEHACYGYQDPVYVKPKPVAGSGPAREERMEHTCIKDDGGTPNRRCYACEAERAASRAKIKGIHIGAPACFMLEEAIRPVCAAFGAYQGSGGCYVVGSSLERPDWRDVDVRLMLDDAAFVREFPNAGEHWEHDARWLLLTIALSEYLSKRTGLPIDFQFQPQTLTNARHKGRRNAIGFDVCTD
jgi:hypothetical protein